MPLPPAPAPSPPPRPAARLAAGYFLGLAVVALVIFLWLRGAGRLLIPMLLLVAVGYGVVRIGRKIREPLP